jgi:hypothetical protein
VDEIKKLKDRETDRQTLLQELNTMLWMQMDEEDIIGKGINENLFYSGVITAIMHYLHGISQTHSPDVYHMSGWNVFVGPITDKIKAFTPVEAERRFVTMGLLKFVVEDMFHRTYTEIVRLSIPPARAQFLREIGLDKM